MKIELDINQLDEMLHDKIKGLVQDYATARDTELREDIAKVIDNVVALINNLDERLELLHTRARLMTDGAIVGWEDALIDRIADLDENLLTKHDQGEHDEQ